MDNGPECSGKRTQFLKQMVDFSDKMELRFDWFIIRHIIANTMQSSDIGVGLKNHGMDTC